MCNGYIFYRYSVSVSHSLNTSFVFINNSNIDAEKQTINTNVKIPPVRKAKVAKLPVATDNNGSSSGSSDDSDPQVPKWNYLPLTDAQRGTLHSSVLAKVGESFIDR